MDFTNFSTKDAAEESSGGGDYGPLSPGEYMMRVVAFSRNQSKAGSDQIVMRLKAIASKDGATGGNRKGTALWYVTLTDKARTFVRRAVYAANGGEDWSGNLLADDDAKNLFLGRLLRVIISNRTFNGKTRERVEQVHAAPEEWLGDDDHENPQTYWDKETFPNNNNSPAKSVQSFDDDIPF